MSETMSGKRPLPICQETAENVKASVSMILKVSKKLTKDDVRRLRDHIKGDRAFHSVFDFDDPLGEAGGQFQPKKSR